MRHGSDSAVRAWRASAVFDVVGGD